MPTRHQVDIRQGCACPEKLRLEREVWGPWNMWERSLRLKAWTGKGPGSWPGCEKMAGRRMNPRLK